MSATISHSDEGTETVTTSPAASLAQVTDKKAYLTVGVALFCTARRPETQAPVTGVLKVKENVSGCRLRLREKEVKVGGILGVNAATPT